MSKVAKGFAALVVIMVVGSGCYGFLGAGVPRSESTYTGYVVDVEYEKGILFKNTKLLMKTHPRSSAVEQFCVKIPQDKQIYEKGRQALINQERVTIEYERNFWENPEHCMADASIVQDITVVGNTSNSTTA